MSNDPLKSPDGYTVGPKGSGNGMWWNHPEDGFGWYSIEEQGDLLNYREHHGKGPAHGWTHNKTTGVGSTYQSGGKG